MDFLNANLKYPKEEYVAGVVGKVLVEFVVEKDGQLTNVKLYKGIPSEALNAEAVRLVRLMDRWEPATLQGEPVRYKFLQPIGFTID
ncbi:MAG: energy transducer TonB [Flavobacteriales bacterium]|nr:energy transducer TonB [Flavobacteriales bacterium]